MVDKIAPHQAQKAESVVATGKVAPHESREVQLVLGGLKPLATIEKDKSPLQYALAVSLAGTGALAITCLNAQDRDCPSGEVVITLPHNRYLIIEYLDLLHNGLSHYTLHEFHAKMGRLFGYSEADIQAFIQQDLGCQCKKCQGG